MSLVNILKEYKSDKDITVIYIGRREGKLYIEDDYELVYFICPTCGAHIYALKFPNAEFMRNKYGPKYCHMTYTQKNTCKCSECSSEVELSFEKDYDYNTVTGAYAVGHTTPESLISKNHLNRISSLEGDDLTQLIIPKTDLKNSLLIGYIKSF